MPRGHAIELTADDFIRAALEIESRGERVTNPAIGLILGMPRETVRGRIQAVKVDPRWKPEWCHPSNCLPVRGKHPWRKGI